MPKTATKKAYKTIGKDGKKLSKYNIFMQVEVRKLRAEDSSLTYQDARQAANKVWKGKNDEDKAAYAPP